MYVRYTGGGPGHYPLENTEEHLVSPEQDEAALSASFSEPSPSSDGLEDDRRSSDWEGTDPDDSEESSESSDDDAAADDGDIEADPEAEGFGAF